MDLIKKIERILGENNLTEETVLVDLDSYDSLNQLSIIAMVKKDYNVILKADDIVQINTISDLQKIINS